MANNTADAFTHASAAGRSGTVRVGVIGGGQLARMMVPPALHLGIDIRVLAESSDMSADIAATAVGDYRDAETVLRFAKDVDVVTFDHEHVPASVLEQLTAAGVSVHPQPAALKYAQDKLLMRQKLSALGVPVPEWEAVYNPVQLQKFLDSHGGKAVVKTPRGGYDGKGVRVIKDAAEVADWFADLPTATYSALLVEELVAFNRELSQLVARRPSGEISLWPVVETVQQDGVCAEVIAPAPAANAAQAQTQLQLAAQIGEQIAAGLGVTGVLAVEMFATIDGRLLVNELAMRPHNSGHFSIEGSVTSQFEQHLRAVCNLPLGSTAMRQPHAVMINVLGGPDEGAMPVRYPAALAAYPDAKFHSYGKQSRPGRKVGHVTVVGSDAAAVLHTARAAAATFNNPPATA